MNCLWRVAFAACRTSFAGAGKQCATNLPGRYKTLSLYSRTMWHMCSLNSTTDKNFLRSKELTELCHCGCNGLMHTQAEKSLADFLQTEIQEERKAQKMSALPSQVSGFSVMADGSELSFQKKNKNETVTITLNVNHSVDTDDNMDDEYSGEMKSKPAFEVDITRNNRTLNFCCSYVTYSESEDNSSLFQIDEIALYDGEWNDKNYTVAGDILDESLYELFMTYLFEKGVTSELMEEVSDVATFYEHSKYITLLEDIHKFSMNK